MNARRALLAFVAATLALATATVQACRAPDERRLTACRAPNDGITKTTFHGSAARLGSVDGEPALAAERVSRGMRSLWTSAPFASLDVAGVSYVGRTYASPLYADAVRMTKGAATGDKLSVVYVATSNGDVYALAASEAACAEGTLAPGSVLWRTRIVTPDVPPALDGREKGGPTVPGIAIGTLSTPVLDLASSPPVLYVTGMDAAHEGSPFPRWKIFALDATNGDLRPGWPVTFERSAVEALDTNGPAYFDEDARVVSQRSALALSPDGDRVYVAFGGYWDGAVGWLAAVDTRAPRLAATFSGAADTLLDQGKISRHANAGMWAPGGPSIDTEGRVYVTTGNSPEGDGPRGVPHSWGNSMLRLGRDLVLESAYSPYDYCELDRRDVDIAGSSPILLPTLSTGTSTPSLVAFGGKAGVVYLLDRDALPSAKQVRAPCMDRWDDAPRDVSLLPPEPGEPYCAGYGRFGADPCIAPMASTTCVRGPLQVFGPAGDDAAVDHAKMRSTPAYFRAEDGTSYVFVSGTTKSKRCAVDDVPPSLVRLRVVAESGKQAHLVRDAADEVLRFANPGSPIVTSDAGRAPVVWVVDQNTKRTQPLLEASTPAPVVYAVDGRTMKLLWKSAPEDLEPGGKYVTPAAAHGVLYVATDRLHAFTAAP